MSQHKKRTPIPEHKFRFVTIEKNPVYAIIQRLALVFGLLLFIATITFIDRDGYSNGVIQTPISFIDALYYSTVSITTTGYGDIVPVTTEARLINTLIVTPARVLFVILLIGTTVELLASKTRFLYRLKRLRKDLNNHVIICGFGIKGQNALAYLQACGKADNVVAIDPNQEALDRANFNNVSGVVGSASEIENLEAANVSTAREVIVCPKEDDQAILIVLRVRELSKKAIIVASCREEKNAELLYSSGADQVVVSASSAGRLLGMAAEYPVAVEMISDLLTVGKGSDVIERAIKPEEVGVLRQREETIVAVVRDGKQIKLNDPELGALRATDRIISIQEDRINPDTQES
jgi:voltage-gated potassium channel